LEDVEVTGVDNAGKLGMIRMGDSLDHGQDHASHRSATKQGLAVLNRCFEAGQLMPVIDGSYKLSEAREAFRHFGAGNHKGKVVITID